ncbi:ATP-binding protein [Roseomonas elaeocarpi]|uniref:histidine kinase n=1 Tax=Roseomonas elaeocarpi TaxID=907779 RepID=A0ABV6JTB2_9PROT
MEMSRLFRAAQDGVDRAAALTHGLLAFARRGRLDPRPVVLDEVVAGMAELMRRTVGPDIEVQLQLADGIWTARIDPGALESALLNLAINARDAMPDGGRLTFATQEMAVPASDLGEDEGVEPGDFLLVSVTDTGEGMSPELLARVLEPFFTTKPIGKGTGLGLSQTYGFVRQSGGFLRIESEPGRGTTVRLFLPRADVVPAGQDVPAAAGDTPATAPGESRRHTILLVEDEPAVRALAAETLRERGYVVLEAADGPSGLAALAPPARVDLLLTDVGLPGLNGRQLADAAREMRPMLPVLFITGYAGMALNNGLPPGMAAVAKPFSLDDLADKVAAMLVRESSPAAS